MSESRRIVIAFVSYLSATPRDSRVIYGRLLLGWYHNGRRVCATVYAEKILKRDLRDGHSSNWRRGGYVTGTYLVEHWLKTREQKKKMFNKGAHTGGENTALQRLKKVNAYTKFARRTVHEE